MTKSPSIAVLGSVNLDFVITTETLPIAGETVGNGSLTMAPGGKGSNVAITVKRLGADTQLWACVGEDAYAESALRNARLEGVDLSSIIRLKDTSTGVAFINVSATGENQIAVVSGANMEFPNGAADQINADAIITQFEIPETIILEAASSSKAFICINASPVGPSLKPLLPYTDLLVFNKGEHDFYAEQIEDFNGLVAVTLGKKGAKVLQKGKTIAEADAIQVSAIDTTGAGDSFAGALTFAILKNLDLQHALEFACTVGALTTTKAGAQSAIPTIAEVESAIRLRATEAL